MLNDIRRRLKQPPKINATLAAGLAFFALAIVFTWPLVLHLATHFPSSNYDYGSDPQVYIWWGDWIYKSLTGALPIPAGLMLDWPIGINPWASYEGSLMLVVLLPARLLTGNPILAYNIFLLLAFATTATAAFWVVRRATGSMFSAAFIGFAFGFSPFMLIRGTLHPNLIMLATIPLATWATVKFAQEPTKNGALWLGAATLLNALSSWYYAVNFMIFIGLAYLWNFRSLWRRRSLALLGLALAALATILPALPMLLQKEKDTSPATLDFMSIYGVRPINLIAPHPFTNIFYNLTGGAYSTFANCQNCPNLVEASSYLGLPLIALVAYVIWRRRQVRMAQLGFWLTAGAVFLVLSLGLDLHVGDMAIPLPLRVLRNVFPFSWARVPNRFFVFALWIACLLAAYGLRDLLQVCKKNNQRAALAALLSFLLLAERIMLPYPLYKPDVPAFYQTMANDGEFYAVADVPVDDIQLSGDNLAQTIHGKPIVTGEFFYRAYYPRLFAFRMSNPLMRYSLCSSEPRQTHPFSDDEKTLALAQMSIAKVRYIIVHNQLLLNESNCSDAKKYIRDFFIGDRPVFTDGNVTIYRVP